MRRWCSTLTAALIWLGVVAPASQAATRAQGVPGPRAGPAAVSRALVDSAVTAQGIPGLSIALSIRGVPVWSEGFGSADLALRVPANAATRFRIASVSKSLTAAALIRLVEDGRLDLDAPIHQYVSRFAEAAQPPVTLRLLSGHLAGVRHRTTAELMSNEPVASVASGLEVFLNDPLLFEPGARFSYSDYGWSLISAAIEAGSGSDFLTYMRRAVFAPLGMLNTGPDHSDRIVPGRTSFYERAPGGAVAHAPPVNNSNRWAATGFLSTAEDLARFGSALLEPGFLSSDGLRTLFTSQRTVDGAATGYGVGWRVGSVNGRPAVWHVGNGVGATCLLMIYPGERLVLAAIANVSGAGLTAPGANPGELPVRIADLFLELRDR